jgi:hypothetical protein
MTHHFNTEKQLEKRHFIKQEPTLNPHLKMAQFKVNKLKRRLWRKFIDWMKKPFFHQPKNPILNIKRRMS